MTMDLKNKSTYDYTAIDGKAAKEKNSAEFMADYFCNNRIRKGRLKDEDL